jgi:hypothetical protein
MNNLYVKLRQKWDFSGYFDVKKRKNQGKNFFSDFQDGILRKIAFG